jgi:2-succinyl-6-hydroxy-2,4-cyclohexadiene-1-carboxylate synthase
MLHGFLGSGEDWLEVTGDLPAGVYAAAPDLPGHGRTGEVSEKPGFETVTAGVAELAGRVFADPPVLVGYSMGGRIALNAARRYPGRFAGLVVESATAGIKRESERDNRFAADIQIADRLRRAHGRDPDGFLRDWYNQPVFSTLTRKQIDGLIESRRHNNMAAAAAVLERLSQGRQPDLWPHLNELTLPVMVMAGANDPKYRRISEQMAAGIPGCSLCLIPEAGHITHMENRHAFVEALTGFLDRCGKQNNEGDHPWN